MVERILILKTGYHSGDVVSTNNPTSKNIGLEKVKKINVILVDITLKHSDGRIISKLDSSELACINKTRKPLQRKADQVFDPPTSFSDAGPFCPSDQKMA